MTVDAHPRPVHRPWPSITAVVDRAHVSRSIRDPDAEVVDGYSPIMPTVDLSDAEIDALVAYIEALGHEPAGEGLGSR